MGDEEPAATPAAGDAPADAAPAAPAAAPEAPSWDPKAWEFDWNGKKVAPESRDKLMTWANQGYNYSQRMAEINRRQKEIEQASERYKGYDRYAEIDQFAKQHPEWMDHVNQLWAQRSSWKPGGAAEQQQAPGAGGPDPAFLEALKPLQSEIEQLRQWREAQLAEQAKVDEQRHDEALSQEIESIRGQNPNIDFDAVDQSGMTLEGRILQHAAEIGTSSFRAAFRDYLHDQLLESAKAAKLAAEAKAPAAAKAAGLLGVTPTPRKGPAAPVSVKGRSWDEVQNAVLAELGIAQ